MDDILKWVAFSPKTQSKNDDDFVDRLSSRYTCRILIVFAVVVTVRAFFLDKPVNCWAPPHFNKDAGHIRYTQSYCWVTNNFYIPMDKLMPRAGEKRENVIPYYQWVPFILLLQALLFYLPSVFWHGLNQKGGVDCDSILDASFTLSQAVKDDKRERTLNLISNQMMRFRSCKHKLQNSLVLLFLFSKVLYMLNVLGQLIVLNSFLASPAKLYGLEVIQYLASDEDWTGSPGVAFPRVTFCDLVVRRLGNDHLYTIQCNLPVNIFTEKIYMFLWFWMLFVAVMTALGFSVWFARALVGTDRVRFVKNHLKVMDKYDRPDEEVVHGFVYEFLGRDVSFVLRLIAHNTNSVNVKDILQSLWVRYSKEQKEKGESDHESTSQATSEDSMKKELIPNAIQPI